MARTRQSKASGAGAGTERLTGAAACAKCRLEAAYAETQQRYLERQREIQALRAQTAQTQSRHHTAQMELLRLQQAVERVQSRATQIAQELKTSPAS
jgi:chromosome segregation protein